MIASYVGENKEFERQYLSGELEVELTPAGHPRRAAAGRRRRDPRLLHRDRRRHPGRRRRSAVAVRRPTGTSTVASPPKDTREFDTAEGPRTYVLERAIITDFALVRAWRRRPARQPRLPRLGAQLQPALRDGRAGHDRRGRGARRAGRARPPNDVHLPGVFVQRVVALTPEQAADKRIERRTTRATPADRRRPAEQEVRSDGLTREQIAARAAVGAGGRRVRQPRHRPADPGAELRARRHRDRAAVRERDPRRRRLPLRGRRRPRPDQRRQGDRDGAAGRALLRLGHLASG